MSLMLTSVKQYTETMSPLSEPLLIHDDDTKCLADLTHGQKFYLSESERDEDEEVECNMTKSATRPRPDANDNSWLDAFEIWK